MENKKGNLITDSIKGYWKPTVLTPVFAFLEVLLEIFLPLLMAAIVDGGLYRSDDFVLKRFFSLELIADEKRFVIFLGVLMISAAAVSLVFGVICGRTAAVAGVGFAKNLRRRLFCKIEEFSFKNTDKYTTASLVTRLTTDVTNVQNSFQMIIRMLVRSPFMLIFASIMAFNINAKLSLLFVVAIPLLALALFILIKIGYPRFVKMFRKYDNLNKQVQENLIGIRVVKSFVREDYEKEKFDKTAIELKKSEIYARKLFSISNPIQLFVMWFSTVLILLFGSKIVIFSTELRAGELVSLVTYSTQIVTALSMITQAVLAISMSKASMDRIREIDDEIIDINNDVDLINKNGNSAVENGDVEFCHVSFSYMNEKDKLALEDINLHIKSGETIGLVGGTGEGKTSLVNLIPRFYDCCCGEVLVGGLNVKAYDTKKLRDGVSFVLQNNLLFSGTIEESVKWGNHDATHEQVIDACKAASAHDFIMSFPDGYNTVLGQGGVNVSGGQKQRLCIARAVLKNPKVLILDDSTSAVDTATDSKIREAFSTSLKGMTKIIIAQRITSICDCDRIIVLDKGKIAGVGTHAQLYDSCEIYREVCDSQEKGEADLTEAR